MSDLTIKTDNKWKELILGYELTDKEKAEFDYMDSDDLETSSFFRYHKTVYSLDQFMRLEGAHSFGGNWNGYHGDSFFSGVLIELSDCGDAYKVATYYS